MYIIKRIRKTSELQYSPVKLVSGQFECPFNCYFFQSHCEKSCIKIWLIHLACYWYDFIRSPVLPFSQIPLYFLFIPNTSPGSFRSCASVGKKQNVRIFSQKLLWLRPSVWKINTKRRKMKWATPKKKQNSLKWIALWENFKVTLWGTSG